MERVTRPFHGIANLGGIHISVTPWTILDCDTSRPGESAPRPRDNSLIILLTGAARAVSLRRLAALLVPLQIVPAPRFTDAHLEA
jgi:hypothetical protein